MHRNRSHVDTPDMLCIITTILGVSGCNAVNREQFAKITVWCYRMRREYVIIYYTIYYDMLIGK